MQAVMKNKIKDIEEFTKLFKINIPIQEEFEYYVETLKESTEFSYLNDVIQSYADLEKHIESNGYSSVRSYKNQKMDELVAYIKSTISYKNLLDKEPSKDEFTSKDTFNSVDENQYLLSLDFKSANYNVLKTFSDKFSNELSGSWEELCEKFYVHEALVKSKSFRQIVFGNTHPKRLQTFQREKIQLLINCLKNNFKHNEEEFVFVSHDEIVIKIYSPVQAEIINLNKKIFQEIVGGMEIRMTPFRLKKIKKNTFLKTIYSINLDRLNNRVLLDFKHTTLQGVPGNKFYMYFKKYILNQPLGERDLLYYNDNELCRWVDEDAIKQKKQNLPHYEKPEYVISLEEAKNNYPFVWDGLSEVLPNMSSEEKRRAIEVFVNTCKHCYQNETGCQCWNDD